MLASRFLGNSQAQPAAQARLIDEIAEHVARLNHKPLRVLDAGAGQLLRLKLLADAKITGIDISEDALSSHTGLSEKIVGDLQTYPLAADAFDASAGTCSSTSKTL